LPLLLLFLLLLLLLLLLVVVVPQFFSTFWNFGVWCFVFLCFVFGTCVLLPFADFVVVFRDSGDGGDVAGVNLALGPHLHIDLTPQCVP